VTAAKDVMRSHMVVQVSEGSCFLPSASSWAVMRLKWSRTYVIRAPLLSMVWMTLPRKSK
jgi:hypothetical protein